MASRTRRRTSLAGRLKAKIRGAFFRMKKAWGVAVLAATCFIAGTQFTGSVDEAASAAVAAAMSAASKLVHIPGVDLSAITSAIRPGASAPARTSATSSASITSGPAAAPSAPRSGALTATVVQVMDGDTVSLLTRSGTSYKARLIGIDAPERDQSGWQASQMGLITLAMGRNASVKWQSTDSFGRLVARVTVEGKDLGLEQLRAGRAWYSRDYAKNLSEAEAKAYEAAETKARHLKLGLWKEPGAQPPWEFREAQQNTAPADLSGFRERAPAHPAKKSLWRRAKDSLF